MGTSPDLTLPARTRRTDSTLFVSRAFRESRTRSPRTKAQSSGTMDGGRSTGARNSSDCAVDRTPSPVRRCARTMGQVRAARRAHLNAREEALVAHTMAGRERRITKQADRPLCTPLDAGRGSHKSTGPGAPERRIAITPAGVVSRRTSKHRARVQPTRRTLAAAPTRCFTDPASESAGRRVKQKECRFFAPRRDLYLHRRALSCLEFRVRRRVLHYNH